jgi:hypothetical protein
LKDVCDVLDIGNSRDVATRLDDDEKGVGTIDTLRGAQEVTIINEGGLFNVILLSRKPEAKKFKRWVTHEVLPSIRRTGNYSAPGSVSATEMEKIRAASKRADAMLNNSRLRIAKFIRETVKDKDVWDYLSPEAKQAYSVYVTETATGQPGLIPLPVVEHTYTASDLGKIYGVSANMIGRIANRNGLKTAEFGFEVLDKARGHDKQVPSFRYNEHGREVIAQFIQNAPETVQ